MGLLIPHFTAPSAIHGTGLFTGVALQAGTLLWCFQPGLDRRYRLSELEASARPAALHYGYINPLWPDWVVICGDRARFWNFPPPGEPANALLSNQHLHQEAMIVAAGPIAAGQELLIEPASDADYFRKMSDLLEVSSCTSPTNGSAADALFCPPA